MVATLGALVFNLFGILGGFLSPAIGKKFGLRKASAIGFGAVFVMLLLLGLFYQSLPIVLAFLIRRSSFCSIRAVRGPTERASPRFPSGASSGLAPTGG